MDGKCARPVGEVVRFDFKKSPTHPTDIVNNFQSINLLLSLAACFPSGWRSSSEIIGVGLRIKETTAPLTIFRANP